MKALQEYVAAVRHERKLEDAAADAAAAAKAAAHAYDEALTRFVDAQRNTHNAERALRAAIEAEG